MCLYSENSESEFRVPWQKARLESCDLTIAIMIKIAIFRIPGRLPKVQNVYR